MASININIVRSDGIQVNASGDVRDADILDITRTLADLITGGLTSTNPV